MRYIESMNSGWLFTKNSQVFFETPKEENESWKKVCLPHTYNHLDGQDGGGDYFRGKAMYWKRISRPAVAEEAEIYLEFEGVNSVAQVYGGEEQIYEHRGGYSAFRVNITQYFKEGYAEISVIADNTVLSDVYPQMADFTFYGGIYRNVNLIAVPKTHFHLDFYGSPGIAYETSIQETHADITLQAWIKEPREGDLIQFVIFDREDLAVAEVFVLAKENVTAKTSIDQPHLWQGISDPYLYRVSAGIIRHNEVLDHVSTKLGIREFYVDPEKGFFLNGVSTPLRGVSRHQDRLGKGNALSEEDHLEDIRLIAELGANTVRLAHYQHDRKFYDACDEAGFVVWAEIPFISVMNKDKNAHENCREQMKELIYQNYNHPSICFWGISNEITIGGEPEGLQENLEDLNHLVKSLDSTRMTTMAQVSMLPKESGQNHITDTLSYNHYFGWYGGSYTQNEEWFDAFHNMYPQRPFGVSEYGCEGIISWHSDTPKWRDYTEEYQAEYHEHMAKVIEERPYLWATHVWNVFDFGCDFREEGGVSGRNNKGLVTLDRKIKKDSFYVYKAYWSKEPFVHIAGRRYSERPAETMTVKVYSNQPEVTLYVNHRKFKTLEADRVFIFEQVPLEEGHTVITAEASGCRKDRVTFRKVKEPNPGYVMPCQPDDGADGVKNWFDDVAVQTGDMEIIFLEGYYSVKDTIGELLDHPSAGKIAVDALNKYGTMKVGKALLGMMNGLTLESMGSMVSQDGKTVETWLKRVNHELQKVKK